MRIYQILAILGSLALIVFIIDFIRRGSIHWKEKTSFTNPTSIAR